MVDFQVFITTEQVINRCQEFYPYISQHIWFEAVQVSFMLPSKLSIPVVPKIFQANINLYKINSNKM